MIGPQVIVRQTGALFLDAYRELNAKKLFWVVLGLSGLCVAAFACIGVNERGLVLVKWQIESPLFNMRMLPSRDFFYKLMFFTLGFKVWLTWAATILALVSTAGIVPDFIASGAIELTLSKPVGRLRLFMTKYLAGLLFVTLQVALFTLGSFLVIGLRGGKWEPGLFVAVPLVVCFFSYLYAISALLGLLTRSAIAALLITVLLWLVMFLIHTAEVGFLTTKIYHDLEVTSIQTDINRREAELAAKRNQAEQAPAPSPAPPAPAAADGTAAPSAAAQPEKPEDPKEQQLRERRSDLDKALEAQQQWRWLHGIAYGVMTALPKTTETIELLQRTLVSHADMEAFQTATDNDAGRGFGDRATRNRWAAAGRESQRIILRDRPIAWVLATSLSFEALVLILAGWIFSRRDF